MSIPAVKAVAIGAGFEGGSTSGARFHDEILFDDERGSIAAATGRAAWRAASPTAKRCGPAPW
jgi:chorismate synthase